MPPQYLRVRRRRNAQTAIMLRMELVGDGKKRNRDLAEEMEAFAELAFHEDDTVETIPGAQASTTCPSPVSRRQQKKPRRTSLVWRRVESKDTTANWHGQHLSQQSPPRSQIPPPSPRPQQQSNQGVETQALRIIDAVLDEDELLPEEGPMKRRRVGRRLTLIDAERQNLVRNSTVPSSRLGETSSTTNKGVAQSRKGTKSGRIRYKVLNPLERMVDASLQQVAVGKKTPQQHWEWCRNDPIFLPDRTPWYEWCNEETGSILHATALWNDPDTTANILSMLREPSRILTARDGEGRTAYDIAQLSGHAHVCQIIEAFGGDNRFDHDDDDDDDYVIDLYCLQDDADVNGEDGLDLGTGGHPTNDEEMVCALRGGYWNDQGELVLESPDDGGGDGGDYVKYFDDDADSNSEGWDGNDYPDDEESDEGEDVVFRHEAAVL